jgi:hypothetical protein
LFTNLIPEGRFPLTVMVAAGFPVVVTVNVEIRPWGNVVEVALVNEGGVPAIASAATAAIAVAKSMKRANRNVWINEKRRDTEG